MSNFEAIYILLKITMLALSVSVVAGFGMAMGVVAFLKLHGVL